jgi:PAS domain S-box-containing protein
MPSSQNGRQGLDWAGGARQSPDNENQPPLATSLLSKLFPGLRAKLIGIFVLIKVVPLLLLALFAWLAAKQLGENVADRSTIMADQMVGTIKSVGDTVTLDATRALDERSSEAIERLTTDTARAVASFLYGRDRDILRAAQLEPSAAGYRAFLAARKRELFAHGPWKLADDGKHWEPATAEGINPALAADPKRALPDNSKDFRARPPEYLGHSELRPLYTEITFVGLDGKERVKATTSKLVSPKLVDVRDRMQTFARAETYWAELRKLRPGEIFVSEVVGTYVASRVLGPYTPDAAKKAGVAYAPKESAYAGTENPVGKRFRGIVRWATPVEKSGKVVGYVTLALDHDHLRQFTDRIVPTDARYTPIIDAIVGNYAFMWDHKGRAIAHPRDYFIPGYNAQTGLPETPWMDQSLYEAWQASGKSSYEFLAETPPYLEQSLKKKPAAALIKAGTVALDCRYLNFSPQCQGWNQLTETGGSGSFVIFFSGLWKLTTAAAIPYYTGQYGRHPSGFGIVTIGANVDDFHKAATESGLRIAGVIGKKDRAFKQERSALLDNIADNLSRTAWGLTLSTGVMVALVILVAIWMANVLTRRITAMTDGIHRFQNGDHGHRLEVKSNDEMGELAASYNRMADTLQQSFADMQNELHTRRRTEEQLRVAATAFESQEGMLVTDARNVILRVNRAFTDITGYTAEEVVGQTPRLLRSDRHAAAFYAAMWESIRRSGAWQGEIWNRRKNGDVFPEWLTVTAVKDENQTVTHYVGTLIDISERKQTEEKLRRFRAAMDATEDAIFLVDRESMRFIDFNNAASNMLRVTREELIAMGPEGVLSTSRRELEKSYDAVIASGASTEAVELLWKARDGTKTWIELRRRVQPSADGWTIVSVGRDITAHKQAELARVQLEAQLRESQKMEALGTLAGGVAHDFNNIIGAIMGNVELARQDVGPGHAAQESLEEIGKASRRAKALVQQILAFGRRQVIDRKAISLAPVVQEAARLLRAALPAGVGLNVQCAPDAPVALADAAQIEQVLLNLCNNAWHAIQGQERPGAIEIRLGAHIVDGAPYRGPERRIRGERIPLRPGRYACLTVRDNGPGMNQATRSRIFEPFFTTKPAGEGTGLGLAVVHGIVHNHEASIVVQSAPGEGTTFRIYFPAAEASAALAPAPGTDAVGANGGQSLVLRGEGKHILYLDDDEAIVFLMTRLLQRQGYRVSGFTDPREALAAVRAAPGEFDLAVTDFNMPGMSGLDVARALKEIRADLPVALASGYITEELRQKAPAAGVSELIYKPNTADDLCEAVARLVTARSGKKNSSESALCAPTS